MAVRFALAVSAGILLVGAAAAPAKAACDPGDRPPVPTNLKASPNGTSTINFQWSWSPWHGSKKIYWDIEVTDGGGKLVDSATGTGGVSAWGRWAVPRKYSNLSPGTQRCLRVRGRTEGGTEGCVSASWAGPVCATTTLPAPSNNWAAVAADGQGHWGYAVGQPSEAVARTKALQGCSVSACKVAMAGQGACVAYAESRSGGYWYGVSIVPTKWQAQSVAKDWCAKGAPKGTCKLVDSICR